MSDVMKDPFGTDLPSLFEADRWEDPVVEFPLVETVRREFPPRYSDLHKYCWFALLNEDKREFADAPRVQIEDRKICFKIGAEGYAAYAGRFESETDEDPVACFVTYRDKVSGYPRAVCPGDTFEITFLDKGESLPDQVRVYKDPPVESKIFTVHVRTAEEPTINGHVYGRSVLEEALKEYQKKVREGRALESCDQLRDVSFVVRRAELEGDKVMADLEVLDTPRGKELAKALKEGSVKIGLTGFGEVDEKGVISDYRLDGFSYKLDREKK